MQLVASMSLSAQNHYDSLVLGRNSYHLTTQYTSNNTAQEQASLQSNGLIRKQKN